MTDKQIQKAGDNSQQIQANNYIVNIGISEERAREIYREMASQLRTYAQEACSVAQSRIKKFENSLLSKMKTMEKALEAFADPAFQLLLLEAQKRAATTERAADYDLLSELLLHRFQKGTDRIVRTGINRAVEIVPEISDEALLGLTILHVASCVTPESGLIRKGLNTLNVLFGRLFYGSLPSGIEWLDQLDILTAIRIDSIFVAKDIRKLYAQRLGGYVDVGIEKSSENYNKAVILLKDCGLSESALVEHELNPNYVRLSLVNKRQIDSAYVEREDSTNQRKLRENLNEKQKNALISIYDLYSKNSAIKEENLKKFMEEWDRLPNLKRLREWWDSINASVQITSVGRVLAHANAQRCDRQIPSLT